jgi:hypothetical protein
MGLAAAESSSRKESFLGGLGKLDDKKIVLRVEIVFTRFIDHSQVTIFGRSCVGQHPVYLAWLQIFTLPILETNNKPRL